MKFGKWSVKVFKGMQCIEASFLAKTRSCQCNNFFRQGWPGENKKELDNSRPGIVAVSFSVGDFFHLYFFHTFRFFQILHSALQFIIIKEKNVCCDQNMNRQICTFFFLPQKCEES